jgi:hypothetical protein
MFRSLIHVFSQEPSPVATPPLEKALLFPNSPSHVQMNFCMILFASNDAAQENLPKADAKVMFYITSISFLI